MADQGNLMLVARKPDDRVEVTLEQLESLLELLHDGDVTTAKMWLVAAIHQGKKDIRERSHK
jgi:hypothetical protein